MYSITFKPMKPCDVQGLLVISNINTAQKYVYNLRGIGQEPLPEEQREIVCTSREKVRSMYHLFFQTYDLFLLIEIYINRNGCILEFSTTLIKPQNSML